VGSLVGLEWRVRHGGIRLCLLPVVALLAACASIKPNDAQIPPFARVPYEPISRDAVVAIALREWRLFGSPMADDPQSQAAGGFHEKPERQQGLWQRVGEYWWLGVAGGTPESKWTGKHDEKGAVFPPDRDDAYPWSAAFVSYVMRIAGAGSRFPYAADHAHYIDIAKRQAQRGDSRWLITAERAEDYAPRLGDLVCRGRDEASNLTFDNLPAGRYFPAHCDFVVDSSASQQIAIVGGNDRDAVTMKRVPVTADGKLLAPETWLVVLRLELPASVAISAR
jgi:uncharacterized protein DUF2272